MRTNNNLLRLARRRCQFAPSPSTRCLIQRQSFRVATISTSSAICMDSKPIIPLTWVTETEERNTKVTGSALETRQSHEQTNEGSSESARSGEKPVLALFTKGIKSTSIVNVYFPGDRRTVSLVFDTRTDAEKAKKDFDGGLCKIHGREVHPTMVERDWNGRMVWELVFDSIPVEILEQDINASVHGLHQPSATIMDEPFTHTEGFATYIHVRNALSRISPLSGWHREPRNDPWAEEKVVAAFSLANLTKAAAAVEALHNKPITIGNRHIEVTAKRLLGLKFRIPATLDGSRIERKLRSTCHEQNIRFQWISGKGSRTYKLYSDDHSSLTTVKHVMAALLDGTIVRTTDETVLWVEEFNDSTHQVTRQPVLVKLKMIEQALRVKFVRDQTARRLIVFGTESQRKLASELACKAARPDGGEIDPGTAHHWHRIDIEEFKSILGQYAPHTQNFLERPATRQTEEEEETILAERPIFRKVINVPSHVASSSKEELERLQRAVGRDPNRPLSLFSPGPRAEGHERPIFRKQVPKLSPYAKAFLDARLNPRYMPSDGPRDLGEIGGVGAVRSSSGETIREEMRVGEHSDQAPPPAAKDHGPNPEGLQKLDGLLNAMRNPSASLARRGAPPLNPIHTPRLYPQASAQQPRSARTAEQEEAQPDPDALKKLDEVLNAMKRD